MLEVWGVEVWTYAAQWRLWSLAPRDDAEHIAAGLMPPGGPLLSARAVRLGMVPSTGWDHLDCGGAAARALVAAHYNGPYQVRTDEPPTGEPAADRY